MKSSTPPSASYVSSKASRLDVDFARPPVELHFERNGSGGATASLGGIDTDQRGRGKERGASEIFAGGHQSGSH